MKKIFAVLAAIFLLAVIACSGGGGDSNSSDSSSSPKSTISGDVSAPSGVEPSSLTVVSLGKETPVSSQGNFSADVYQDGVAVVAAIPDGKSFGLINVVVTNSTKSSDNIVAASAYKGTTGSGVSLDVKTTAVSLVFLSPYFITNDPTVTSTLLPIIESDPKVAVLASVIENVFNSADPLNEPSFQQALIDAVQSVINTLTTQNKSVAASEIAPSGVKILQVPKISTFKSLMKAVSLSPTNYYADQDYITVKAETSATGYDVTVESKNAGSIDWIAETMKIDSTQFASFSDFQTKASNNRTIYNNERQDVLGKLEAPAKSVFRYFDIIQVAFDWTFDYLFGAKALDQIPVSSNEDGIYLIRSYSGSTGQIMDSPELSFIYSKVPNGTNMNHAALATNMLMVCLDTTSIFLDIKSINIDTVVKAGMKAFEDEVSLVNNPTMKDLVGISGSVIKAMIKEETESLLKKGFHEMFEKSAKILAKSAIDVPGKISNIGKIADRLLQMLTSGTPMETSYVVVGNPFPSAYAVSGRVTYNGAGLAGVKVTVTGDSSISAQTGSDGSYTFNLAHGSYTLTSSLSGYTFNPSTLAVTVNYNDKTIQDIVATKNTTNPTVAMTPMSIKPGETVTEWGTGFTPNSTATLHFSKPDSTEFTPLLQAIKSDGTFSITYTIPTDRTPGTYTWWGVDSSGKISNTVSFTITTVTTYSMSGTIHVGSNSGAVLSGATISIAGRTATTISDGTFTITGIPAGTYAFSVSKSGYDTYTNSAYYVGSNQTGLNFYLTVTASSGDYTSTHIGTLKYVPAGSFQRDDTATNISTVSAFRMSKNEITRAQFLAIMGVDFSDTEVSSGTSDPAQMVNWYDAVEFCNKLSIAEGLTPVYTITGRTPATGYPIDDATVTPAWSNNGYRLPTEMEWMWAAMGATSGYGYTGGTYTTGYTKVFAGSSGSNVIGDYAWYYDNSGSTTHPVGIKLPNELGLHDMSGNVWEWCWDGYGRPYPTGAQTNYRGAASGAFRVIRGGGWRHDASGATVADRGYDDAGGKESSSIGFRVVRN